MKVPGPLCPMTQDGRHKLRPFAPYRNDRGGLACQRCHKSFVWQGDALIYPSQENPHD